MGGRRLSTILPRTSSSPAPAPVPPIPSAALRSLLPSPLVDNQLLDEGRTWRILEERQSIGK